MFARVLLIALAILSPVLAQDIRLPFVLVIPDDPDTEINEARETVRVLNYWRQTQIIGLTEDGDKILAHNSIKDVLAEELNRYIAAIITDMCNTRMDACPDHLKDDFQDADVAITRQKRRTKKTVRID